MRQEYYSQNKLSVRVQNFYNNNQLDSTTQEWFDSNNAGLRGYAFDSSNNLVLTTNFFRVGDLLASAVGRFWSSISAGDLAPGEKV